jgi:hypothetical protein
MLRESVSTLAVRPGCNRRQGERGRRRKNYETNPATPLHVPREAPLRRQNVPRPPAPSRGALRRQNARPSPRASRGASTSTERPATPCASRGARTLATYGRRRTGTIKICVENFRPSARPQIQNHCHGRGKRELTTLQSNSRPRLLHRRH